MVLIRNVGLLTSNGAARGRARGVKGLKSSLIILKFANLCNGYLVEFGIVL